MNTDSDIKTAAREFFDALLNKIDTLKMAYDGAREDLLIAEKQPNDSEKYHAATIADLQEQLTEANRRNDRLTGSYIETMRSAGLIAVAAIDETDYKAAKRNAEYIVRIANEATATSKRGG